MKGFAMVTMTLPSSGLVDVYTLHAEAGGTAEDQRLQGEDFTQLAEFIAATSAGRAVILGGDTNLHTDGTHPDAEGDRDLSTVSPPPRGRARALVARRRS